MFGHWFVKQYLMSFLALQSPHCFRKRELVTLLLMSSCCHVTVSTCVSTSLCHVMGGLQCVIVAFLVILIYLLTFIFRSGDQYG